MPTQGNQPTETTGLSHDDYCRIFGRVIFDAFFRIDNLENQVNQFGEVYKSFQAQAERLRLENESLRQQTHFPKEG